MDKAVWNEQWMGWPVGAHYEEQSNYTLAENLQGKLLLAHGDLDENVPVSVPMGLTTRIISVLLKLKRSLILLLLAPWSGA